MNAPELGMLVTARAGRDRGGQFLIVGRYDEAHVLLADGDSRKAARPKKKKLMHLRVEPALAADIREKLLAGEELQDAAIRKAIAALNQQRRQD